MKSSHTHIRLGNLRTQRGLTLIELMVTVGVAIIVLAMGVPSFVDVLRSNKLTTTVNDFVQAIHLTRNEAVKAGGATLCASNDQSTCSGTDWTKGWIIFSDFNFNAAKDAGEPVVRVGNALPQKMTINASASSVTFARTGFLTPVGVRTFTFCGGRTGDDAGRTVTVNNAGRPTVDPYDSCT